MFLWIFLFFVREGKVRWLHILSFIILHSNCKINTICFIGRITFLLRSFNTTLHALQAPFRGPALGDFLADLVSLKLDLHLGMWSELGDFGELLGNTGLGWPFFVVFVFPPQRRVGLNNKCGRSGHPPAVSHAPSVIRHLFVCSAIRTSQERIRIYGKTRELLVRCLLYYLSNFLIQFFFKNTSFYYEKNKKGFCFYGFFIVYGIFDWFSCALGEAVSLQSWRPIHPMCPSGVSSFLVFGALPWTEFGPSWIMREI